MSNNRIIAISGQSGCGNSSVSKIVAEQLHLRFINYTFHDMADELKMPFPDLMKAAEQDSQYDLELDRKQVAFALRGECILGSRLAIWLLKDLAVKIYLDASVEIRSQRIAAREQKPFKTALKETAERDQRDHDRFMKLYSIDNDRYDFADLIINTEEGDQYFVAKRIIDFLC
ncbi:MAG: cytidylate kinase family protein [Spirochaetales bacterium]|nr:cytidylate kinase family protein [Spirochaetales bacterium]